MNINNYGNLAELIWNELDSLAIEINKIIIVDTVNPANPVIRLTPHNLIHKAIMATLAETGVTKPVTEEDKYFLNGVAINLEKITFDLNSDGELRISIFRDPKINRKMIEDVTKKERNETD